MWSTPYGSGPEARQEILDSWREENPGKPDPSDIDLRSRKPVHGHSDIPRIVPFVNLSPRSWSLAPPLQNVLAFFLVHRLMIEAP